MKPLAIALVCLAGCAHLESRAAAPGDMRAVVVVLSSSNPFCDDCRAFEAKLADRDIVSALAAVRLVRYDVDSAAGSEALERLLGPRLELRPPLVAGVVDDRAVRGLTGATASVETLVAFIHDVAGLGGDGAEYASVASGGDGSPELMLRAARWHEARRHTATVVPLWRRLSARADAAPDMRAEADWSLAHLERHGAPSDPHASLRFAKQHPATLFGWYALVAAAQSAKVSRDEVGAALHSDFAAAASVGRQADVVLVALATRAGDVALELATTLVGDPGRAAPRDLLALAEVHYARGQQAEAVKFAERALAGAPDSPSIRAAVDRIRQRAGAAPFVRSLIFGALSTSLRFALAELRGY